MVHKIFLIFSIIISMALYCCSNKQNVYNHTAEIIDLGDNYYYLGDGTESQILLNLKPEAKSKFGKTIIPPEVILYNYDKNFIIAQTLDRINSKEFYKYWIVDKMKKNQDLIISLDSVNFYKNLDSLKIKIKLESR